MAIGAGMIGLIFGIPMLALTIVVSGIGSAMTRPSVTTLITKSVEPYEQGAALGVSQSLASIAQMIGPLIAGFMIQHDQLALYGMASGLFALLGAAVALRHEREDIRADIATKEG
jgi:MFS transporter, DHA1 family, tetracycline resistance protein